MWFGPGVQVVAQVPVAGPVKNKKSVWSEKFLQQSLSN